MQEKSFESKKAALRQAVLKRMRGRKESNEGSREKEGILSKVRKGKAQSDMEVVSLPPLKCKT